VNSQRLTQGQTDNFDLEFTRSNVTLSLELGVLNNDVIFAGNRRTKTNAGSKPDLLMQNSPCSDKVFQSLEIFFRFSTLRTSKSTPLFGWTKTLTSSNERSSSKSLKSLLLIRSQYFNRAFFLASSKPQGS
jgi:hypothetical protein